MTKRSFASRRGALPRGIVMALLLSSAAPAAADVSLRETVTLSGPGAVAGGGTIEMRVQLAGERRRQDLSVKGGKAWLELERLGLSASSTIARFDTGDWLRIRPLDSSVIVETWAEAAERIARVSGNRADAPPFRNAVTSMEAPALVQSIAGIECKRVILDITGDLGPEGEPPARRLRLRAELWVAGNFPGRSELESFRRKEIERLGRDPVIAQYAALAPPRYARAIEELGRNLAQVDGVPLEMLLTITSPLAGASVEGGSAGAAPDASLSEETGPVGTAEGLRRASAPTKLRQRTDMGRKYAAAGAPTAPEWALSTRVTELDAKPVEAARFEAPAAFRRLVPKSRRQAPVAVPPASS